MKPAELKQLRKERGLSLRAAARIYRITYQYLAKLENGAAPINADREELIRSRIAKHDEGENDGVE